MRSVIQEVAVYKSGQRKRPPLRYEADLIKMPRFLIDAFERSCCDTESSEFIAASRDVSLVKLLIVDVLRFFVSRTTANGIVGRGGMFVMSNAQARSLLRPPGVPAEQPLAEGHKFASLLDIGAGDGGVTARVAPLFEKVYATEFSASMRWRLKRRGYEVLNHEDPFHYSSTSAPSNDADATTTTTKTGTSGEGRRLFDVIACFNVLDRADKPLTLLREMRDSLKPETGLLLLAVVLPWCPFVEDGVRQQAPLEQLPMTGGECCKGASYEASLTKLVENVLLPCGFELVRWTRLPYLCEGNLRVEYALLNDAVFILRRKEGFVDVARLSDTVEPLQAH